MRLALSFPLLLSAVAATVRTKRGLFGCGLSFPPLQLPSLNLFNPFGGGRCCGGCGGRGGYWRRPPPIYGPPGGGGFYPVGPPPPFIPPPPNTVQILQPPPFPSNPYYRIVTIAPPTLAPVPIPITAPPMVVIPSLPEIDPSSYVYQPPGLSPLDVATTTTSSPFIFEDIVPVPVATTTTASRGYDDEFSDIYSDWHTAAKEGHVDITDPNSSTKLKTDVRKYYNRQRIF